MKFVYFIVLVYQIWRRPRIAGVVSLVKIRDLHFLRGRRFYVCFNGELKYFRNEKADWLDHARLAVSVPPFRPLHCSFKGGRSPCIRSEIAHVMFLQ